MPAAIAFTARGLEKLRASVAAAVQGAERAAVAEMLEMRATAARLAPNANTEAWLLSEGFVTAGIGAGYGTGSVAGTPEGGRFFREGRFIPLQEAIRTQPIEQVTEGTRVLVGACSARQINIRTAFYWNTRKRGKQGPSYPFNYAYVQAVENGGVVWTVRPRFDNKGALEPEPGLFALEMAKTMRPFRMFATAKAIAQRRFRRRATVVIRREVRRVGR